MSSKILVISKEQVRTVRDRLSDPAQIPSCIEEVRKMIEIKSVLSWRAEVSEACCGAELSMCLFNEVQNLEEALQYLESGNIDEATILLEEYEAQIINTQ